MHALSTIKANNLLHAEEYRRAQQAYRIALDVYVTDPTEANQKALDKAVENLRRY